MPAYNYHASVLSVRVGKKLNMIRSGTIFATNKVEAMQWLKSLNYGLVKPLSLNISESILDIIKKDFDSRDLVRAYDGIAKRINSSQMPSAAIEQCLEFVSDKRLKQALMLAAKKCADGFPLEDAMKMACFPKRDCAILSSGRDTNLSTTLTRLALDIKRRYTLTSAIKKLLFGPKVTVALFSFLTWACLCFLSGQTILNLEKSGMKLEATGLLANYVTLVKYADANKVIFSTVYFAICGGVFLLLRSRYVKRLFESIEVYKNIVIRMDLMTTWSTYGLLVMAGNTHERAAGTVKKSCEREDCYMWWSQYEKLLKGGELIQNATARAGFPEAIVQGIWSASSGGNIDVGIEEMCKNMEISIEDGTSVLEIYVKYGTMLLLGIALMVVFIASYGPNLLMLKNLL